MIRQRLENIQNYQLNIILWYKGHHTLCAPPTQPVALSVIQHQAEEGAQDKLVWSENLNVAMHQDEYGIPQNVYQLLLERYLQVYETLELTETSEAGWRQARASEWRWQALA